MCHPVQDAGNITEERAERAEEPREGKCVTKRHLPDITWTFAHMNSQQLWSPEHDLQYPPAFYHGRRKDLSGSHSLLAAAFGFVSFLILYILQGHLMICLSSPFVGAVTDIKFFSATTTPARFYCCDKDHDQKKIWEEMIHLAYRLLSTDVYDSNEDVLWRPSALESPSRSTNISIWRTSWSQSTQWEEEAYC